MSGYLAYSYSCGLTKDKKIEIDKRVKESQKEFLRGANAGFKISLTFYSIHSLTTRIANASDQRPTSNTCPSSAPNNKPTTGVVKPKPGFKPVPGAVKDTAIGGATVVCGAALQSGDFIYGSLCAMLLIGISWVNNRE